MGIIEPPPAGPLRERRLPTADEARVPDSSPVDEKPLFDLRAAWATIYRSRWPMAAIFGLAVLAGIGSILFTPRIYKASASVQIDQQAAKVLGTEDTEPQAFGSDADRFLQTQVDVLNSRATARRVAESLGLAGTDDFLKRMSGKATIKPASDGATREERVLDTLQKNLAVDLKRNSRVVSVIFASRDPKLAAAIANSYAANFIEGNIQRKFSTTAYSRRFLQNQLALAKGRLEGSERSLITYARSARLIDASAGARQTEGVEAPRSLVTANLVQLNADFATAEANRVRARERWAAAQATPLMSLPEVLENEAVQRLTQRRAEQMAKLAELKGRLKADHPTVVQASAELASLDTQIRQIAEATRNSIRSQYVTAERQRGALAGQVRSLQVATLSEQDRSVRYNILKREVDTNRQLYESLLQRFKEVSAEAGVTSNNITVVDTAEAPRKPTSPRPLVNLALALIAGSGLALLFAFGRDYLDDTLRDPQDVEQKLRLPLLGVVPRLVSGTPAAALEDPKSELAEAYHTARSSIDLSSNQGLSRSLLVTGSGQSEGKSTTSYALAHDYASVGRRVLLVDADLRRPSLHGFFGGDRGTGGLSSVLARLSQPAEVIRRTEVANLDFMPSGPQPPNPATLFSGAVVGELLARLSDDYDIVVVDGPPVLALADATQLGAAAQATVLALEADGAHLGQARQAIARLTRANANVIGCIITKYDPRRSGLGDDYDLYNYSYEERRA